jgi:hypothetical protein
VRSKRAVVGAILTLGILVLSSGTAAADGRGKGKHKGDTLRLVGTTIQEEILDLGAPGPSLGDQLVFSEVLRYRGREVGTSGAVCSITEAVPPYPVVVVYHCVGTLSLGRGQITLQGLVETQGIDDPGPFLVAITGGTGAYRGAGGEAVVRDPIGDRRIYKLSFDSKSKKKKHRRH